MSETERVVTTNQSMHNIFAPDMSLSRVPEQCFAATTVTPTTRLTIIRNKEMNTLDMDTATDMNKVIESTLDITVWGVQYLTLCKEPQC